MKSIGKNYSDNGHNGITPAKKSICGRIAAYAYTVPVAAAAATILFTMTPSSLKNAYQHISPPDEQKLVLLDPAIAQDEMYRVKTKASNPGATFLHGPQLSRLEGLTAEIKDQVSHKGTLDTLQITTHGNSGIVVLGTENVYSVNEVLDSLQKTKTELGKPLAKRIVFTACKLGKDMGPQQIKEISRFAGDLGSDVVMSLSTVTSYNTQGYFARFGADGSITKDKMTKQTLYDSIQGVAQSAFSSTPRWLDYYDGKTIQQGEKDYKKAIENRVEQNLTRQAKARPRHRAPSI